MSVTTTYCVCSESLKEGLGISGPKENNRCLRREGFAHPDLNITQCAPTCTETSSGTTQTRIILCGNLKFRD